ncbi:MAG: sugar MFS transporter [Flavobacteriales bacterium]|nr:sugar MFS transporter [Flavobacteriales bacterium]
MTHHSSSARPTTHSRAMVVLTTLFFMWGFMTVMNDILVPHLKAVFTLNYTQSMLVQFCFFGAYFLGSLAYFLVSRTSGDPLQRMGYKRGLISGLLLSALGSALFVPATFVHSYAAYLVALFVLGLGFTLLQIAANPFVAIIGAPEGASSRLNLAQAFNSLGTTLAPLIGGVLIFEFFKGDAAVRWPYAFFAALLLFQALWIALTTLPEPPHVPAGTRSDAFRHPQLRRGMLAIFCYVGAEVAVGSLIINFLKLDGVLGLPETDAKNFLGLYWGGAMVGRFLGALAMSDRFSAGRKPYFMLVLAVALFALLGVINWISGGLELRHLWPMGVLILGNMGVFLIAGRRPGAVLGVFALSAALLAVLVMFSSGAWALWAVVAIGLFNSIQWSNIFTLAIDGLGDDTGQGSSLLVMMIVGGALVPPLQGLVIDRFRSEQGFHLSFALPVLCYAYLAWYGFKGARHA